MIAGAAALAWILAAPAALAGAKHHGEAAARSLQGRTCQPPAGAKHHGEASARSLQGHTFQPPALLEGPFTTTHIGIDTSLGLLVQDGAGVAPTAPTRLQLPARNGQKLLLFSERLAVGIAPTRGVELGARAALQGSAGGDAPSGYHHGVQTGYDVRPHVAFELLHSHELGLSLGLRAGMVMTGGVRARPSGLVDAMMLQADQAMRNPARFVCLRDGNLGCAFRGFDGAGAMRVDERAFGVHTAMSAAKSFGRHVGVQLAFGAEALDARVSGGKGLETRTAPRSYTASVAAAVDLAPIVPISTMLEAGLERGENRGLDQRNAQILGTTPAVYTAERLAAGVYYTGRDALALGLVGTYAFVQERRIAGDASLPGPPSRNLGGRFSLRYFF